MKLKDRVLLNLKERRERLLSGKINSIPSPLLRFKEDFVGVEQGKFYLVTAATKAGKSQFASFMFIYNTLLYAYAHPEQVNVKIIYYPLEETPENVMERFMSYLLYTLSEFKIRISPQDLKSTDNSKPLSEEILNILNSKEYGEILQFFEDSITFSYSTNATGVWKECKKYAEENGTVHTKPIIIKDDFGLTKEVNAFDYYESNNPNEYRIIFFDHLSLISTEKGMDLAIRIETLFNKRCKELKNNLKLNFGVYFTPAENLCYTAMKNFTKKYGVIPNVSDHEYFTNSMHIPVFVDMNPFDKIDLESKLTGLSNGGCITYVELPSSAKNNIDAMEELVKYAMNKDIPYFAVNVPIDYCPDCGYEDEIAGDVCPKCGGKNIKRLRRVTGYITGDYKSAFNYGKQCEVKDRVKHIKG